MKKWVIDLPWGAIHHAAKKHNFDPYLVGALVMQESAGDAMAVRYEAGYRWLYQPEIFARANKITIATEEVLQACSWGLMQCMGANFRQLGYSGPLPAVVDIETNLDFGLRFLTGLAKRYDKHGIDAVIAAYNAGSPRRAADGKSFVNQSYVDSVNAHIREFRCG